MRVHPDTYLPRLSAFTTYDGATMPKSHEWDDSATPRTDRPVTLSRTGPTPASQWGICRVIRAARASFPFGPQS